MNDTLLLLVIIFGMGMLIAVQGYNFLMQGQSLLSPEARHRTGGRFVYTGLALIITGSVVAVGVVISMIMMRSGL